MFTTTKMSRIISIVLSIIVFGVKIKALNAEECLVNGLYPDTTNCSRFYMCAAFGPVLFQCPSGLHFNPSLNYCDWPVNATCDLLATSPSQAPPSSVNPITTPQRPQPTPTLELQPDPTGWYDNTVTKPQQQELTLPPELLDKNETLRYDFTAQTLNKSTTELPPIVTKIEENTQTSKNVVNDLEGVSGQYTITPVYPEVSSVIDNTDNFVTAEYSNKSASVFNATTTALPYEIQSNESVTDTLFGNTTSDAVYYTDLNVSESIDQGSKQDVVEPLTSPSSINRTSTVSETSKSTEEQAFNITDIAQSEQVPNSENKLPTSTIEQVTNTGTVITEKPFSDNILLSSTSDRPSTSDLVINKVTSELLSTDPQIFTDIPTIANKSKTSTITTEVINDKEELTTVSIDVTDNSRLENTTSFDSTHSISANENNVENQYPYSTSKDGLKVFDLTTDKTNSIPPEQLTTDYQSIILDDVTSTIKGTILKSSTSTEGPTTVQSNIVNYSKLENTNVESTSTKPATENNTGDIVPENTYTSIVEGDVTNKINSVTSSTPSPFDITQEVLIVANEVIGTQEQSEIIQILDSHLTETTTYKDEQGTSTHILESTIPEEAKTTYTDVVTVTTPIIETKSTTSKETEIKLTTEKQISTSSHNSAPVIAITSTPEAPINNSNSGIQLNTESVSNIGPLETTHTNNQNDSTTNVNLVVTDVVENENVSQLITSNEGLNNEASIQNNQITSILPDSSTISTLSSTDINLSINTTETSTDVSSSDNNLDIESTSKTNTLPQTSSVLPNIQNVSAWTQTPTEFDLNVQTNAHNVTESTTDINLTTAAVTNTKLIVDESLDKITQNSTLIRNSTATPNYTSSTLPELVTEDNNVNIIETTANTNVILDTETSTEMSNNKLTSTTQDNLIGSTLTVLIEYTGQEIIVKENETEKPFVSTESNKENELTTKKPFAEISTNIATENEIYDDSVDQLTNATKLTSTVVPDKISELYSTDLPNEPNTTNTKDRETQTVEDITKSTNAIFDEQFSVSVQSPEVTTERPYSTASSTEDVYSKLTEISSPTAPLITKPTTTEVKVNVSAENINSSPSFIDTTKIDISNTDTSTLSPTEILLTSTSQYSTVYFEENDFKEDINTESTKHINNNSETDTVSTTDDSYNGDDADDENNDDDDDDNDDGDEDDENGSNNEVDDEHDGDGDDENYSINDADIGNDTSYEGEYEDKNDTKEINIVVDPANTVEDEVTDDFYDQENIKELSSTETGSALVVSQEESHEKPSSKRPYYYHYNHYHHHHNHTKQKSSEDTYDEKEHHHNKHREEYSKNEILSKEKTKNNSKHNRNSTEVDSKESANDKREHHHHNRTQEHHHHNRTQEHDHHNRTQEHRHHNGTQEHHHHNRTQEQHHHNRTQEHNRERHSYEQSSIENDRDRHNNNTDSKGSNNGKQEHHHNNRSQEHKHDRHSDEQTSIENDHNQNNNHQDASKHIHSEEKTSNEKQKNKHTQNRHKDDSNEVSSKADEKIKNKQDHRKNTKQESTEEDKNSRNSSEESSEKLEDRAGVSQQSGHYSTVDKSKKNVKKSPSVSDTKNTKNVKNFDLETFVVEASKLKKSLKVI